MLAETEGLVRKRRRWDCHFARTRFRIGDGISASHKVEPQ